MTKYGSQKSADKKNSNWTLEENEFFYGVRAQQKFERYDNIDKNFKLLQPGIYFSAAT